MTAASVTIDAGILAVPVQNGTKEDAYRYVETLLEWSSLFDEPWVAIYMSERASEALEKDGLFPLHNQLRDLFDSSGIKEYSVNDVTRVVNDLLQRTPYFETNFCVRDVLYEELKTEPDILRLCSGTSLQSDLARCVVLIALLRHHCRSPVPDHLLILRHAPSHTIRIRSLIHEIEHGRDDMISPPTPPHFFDGDILACDDFSGLVQCLDEGNVLLKASDDIGMDTSIRIAFFKSRLFCGANADWNEIPTFRIGQKFLSSFQGCNPTKQLSDNLLTSIVHTVEGTNMSRTHPLRTGAGGGNPQRTRNSDKAKAWRRDIDSEHHLHYWVCEDNAVELAWVSYPHDDFTMPE